MHINYKIIINVIQGDFFRWPVQRCQKLTEIIFFINSFMYYYMQALTLLIYVFFNSLYKLTDKIAVFFISSAISEKCNISNA